MEMVGNSLFFLSMVATIPDFASPPSLFHFLPFTTSSGVFPTTHTLALSQSGVPPSFKYSYRLMTDKKDILLPGRSPSYAIFENIEVSQFRALYQRTSNPPSPFFTTPYNSSHPFSRQLCEFYSGPILRPLPPSFLRGGSGEVPLHPPSLHFLLPDLTSETP